MANRNASIPMLPLDAAQMARFDRNAPAALSRRTPGVFVEQGFAVAEYFFVAAVSLVGVFVCGWNAAAMVVFFLANIWMGTLGDAAKYLLARKAVQRLVDTWNDDNHVWAVADALREHKSEIRADTSGSYLPSAGLFVDFVFGGVATGVMLLALSESKSESLLAPFAADRTLLIAFVATIAVQVVAVVAQVVRHSRPAGAATPMKFGAGARGTGLFLLLFGFVFTSAAHDPKGFLIAANVALMLLGLMGILGYWLMVRETRWLRAHLGAKGGASLQREGAGSPPSRG